MKHCTLRKLESGEIICTVDENIKRGDACMNKNAKQLLESCSPYNLSKKDYFKIIASTISNVGKPIKFSKHDKVLTEGVSTIRFNKEYDYTELETSIIIKL